MLKKFLFVGCTLALMFVVAFISYAVSRHQQVKYILENEKDIGVEQSGPHNGGGVSTAYNFFSKAKNLKLAFRKRVLKPGSAIGYHDQSEDEIYYILSGTGSMQMNGEFFQVKAGDAILTRSGSSHGLKQTGTTDLVLIINYAVK